VVVAAQLRDELAAARVDDADRDGVRDEGAHDERLADVVHPQKTERIAVDPGDDRRDLRRRRRRAHRTNRRAKLGSPSPYVGWMPTICSRVCQVAPLSMRAMKT
jgi:hypothetical protein